jgi:hypothetical protein
MKGYDKNMSLMIFYDFNVCIFAQTVTPLAAASDHHIHPHSIPGQW